MEKSNLGKNRSVLFVFFAKKPPLPKSFVTFWLVWLVWLVAGSHTNAWKRFSSRHHVLLALNRHKTPKGGGNQGTERIATMTTRPNRIRQGNFHTFDVCFVCRSFFTNLDMRSASSQNYSTTKNYVRKQSNLLLVILIVIKCFRSSRQSSPALDTCGWNSTLLPCHGYNPYPCRSNPR